MKESQIQPNPQIDNQDKNNLGFINRLAGSNKTLSSEETREILTPFAFTVDESLFGISIARPWRRGLALLIDLFFIALLSQAPGELLALLVALTLFRLGNLNTTKKNQKYRLRYRFLKFVSVLIVFVMLLETLPSLFSQVDNFNRNVERAEKITESTQQLKVNSLKNSIASPDNNVRETPEANEALKTNNNLTSIEYEDDTQRYDENRTLYKGFAWLKGLIEDLGIGFGWAAFYFTMFTAIWFGQTPGKKLLRIRVLQLDGTALSVWDSFGRYGGYGAGIATGLLGFAQIYWDPNRQAIHDKISATIVIYCGKNNRITG